MSTKCMNTKYKQAKSVLDFLTAVVITQGL